MLRVNPYIIPDPVIVAGNFVTRRIGYLWDWMTTKEENEDDNETEDDKWQRMLYYYTR